MKKIITILIFSLIVFMFFQLGTSRFSFAVDIGPVFADDSTLSKNVNEIIEDIDDKDLEELLSGLDDAGKGVFGSLSFKDRLKGIINGDDTLNYNSVFGYLAAVFFGEITNLLPFILLILGVCAAFSIVNSMKSEKSESVTNIIRFACVAVIAVVLFGQIFAVIVQTTKTINSINNQINVIFPIILTMMAATGSTGAVAAYTPAVAILGGSLTGIITVFVLPCFILSVVFDIVGNLSDTVKLKKMSGFFFSSLKWIMGSAFFVFLAFLSVKGITASIRDGVSIRTAKYAISNYVPIIGGYLSEGFNLVMAGSVLIKNAVGISAMVLLLVTIAPLIVYILVFSLSVSLLGAIVEPLGLPGISNIMSGIGKSLKSLMAIILGMSFLYFVFLLLTVCTGNLLL